MDSSGWFDALTDLVDALYGRFKADGRIDNLDEVITLLRDALELQPIRESRGSCDLEEAITFGRAALELCPPGHRDRCVSLHNLGCDLRTRFMKQAAVADLEEAIELLRTTLELQPSGHPHRSSSLHQLSLCLWNRYENQGAVADLEEAITLGRAALELRPRGHPDRVISLNKQASICDLEEAIKLLRAALELNPYGNLHQAFSYHELALCLSDRYDSQGVLTDLEEAIKLGLNALELHLPGHPDHGVSLYNLACNLRRSFGTSPIWTSSSVFVTPPTCYLSFDARNSSTGPFRPCFISQQSRTTPEEEVPETGFNMDLEEAIELLRSALELRPSGHIIGHFHSTNLRSVSRTDMTIRGAVPPAHLDRGVSLINLACDLRRRFQKQATRNDLEEAIELLREALKLCPSGHPSGAVTDLEEAVTLRRTALEILPLGHPHRSVVLYNLAVVAQSNFSSSGPVKRPVDVPFSFFELSLHFWVRFQKQAALADLDEAIVLQQHPDYTVFFKQLACFVEERVQRLTQQSKSLGPAVDNLGALANYLRDRSRNQRVIADLAEPITLHRYVLQFRPTGHPSRASSLHDLAQCLVDRFRQRPATAGLDEAIYLSKKPCSYSCLGIQVMTYRSAALWLTSN
ncbi:hypothetical protein EDC04DRAFT_2912663 [Pisolithus marmoratus]|nr:hypothetical protein EDC04DRAFT_2912663 [Pisolithus marmoratus]